MKDYYLLLGVNKKADKSEIKKAYRDSAKKFHPDACDSEGDAKRFREITEAYETLCNSDKRKIYDEGLGINVPLTSSHKAEPLRPRHSHFKQKRRPNPYVRDFDKGLRPEAIRREAGSKKKLSCIIHLTPQEIRKDVEYPYTVHVIKPCPHCNSFFSGFLFFCPYCNNSQYLYLKKELLINIPKGVESGTCVCLNLDHVGLSGAKLMVEVLISAD